MRTRLDSPPAAERRRAGSIGWPILAPVGAVALMAGAPSAAYAQCFGQFNAITSVAGTVNTAFLPSGSAFLSSSPNSLPDQQGGGAWTRGVAGTVDTSSNTVINSSFPVPGIPVPPTSCRTTVKQNYAGFEAGHDIAVLNANNAEWHFGVLAGYVGARIQFPGQNAEVPAQDGDLQAPSAGLYASFSKGNFFADVQGRVYFLQADSLGQRLDGRGFSLAGNMSYRFDLPGNWSLEPSVGGIFSRTSVDPLNIAAVGGTLPNPGIPGPPVLLVAESGTLRFQDVDSFLGRASIKLGTSVPLAGGQIVAYPFATASVFHEFEGTAAATLASSGTVVGTQIPFQGISSFTASGVGTYGQFGGGSAFQFANTGWLGYARFDYRTGENVQGYSVSAGLRYQLEPENRARHPEMFVKARPSGDYDWTGPYAGISAGSTWGRTHWALQGGPTDPDFAGVLAGGQAGYNFQRGKFVGGIEADAGWSNARGAAGCPSQAPFFNPLLFNCEGDIGALGSLTGRFGYTWGRALFYAKGGWAFGEVTAARSVNFIDPGVAATPPGAANGHSTIWENGWTVGTGMEFALTDRWSAKAEYMHYAFPRYVFTVGQNTAASATATGDLVRIGVNYHFAPR